MKKVTVIDYGLCNILSVKRAFEYCGADVCITDSPKDVLNASYLVMPGVGAFADGMKGLGDRNLVEPILEYCSGERPFLGICLGMQMMLDKSEEFGLHKGLGLIKGKVLRIPDTDTDGVYQKVPHIGWNELKCPKDENGDWWGKTILHSINEGDMVYFVHSYTAWPEDKANRIADVYYGGRRISAVIGKNYIYGSQFHPEKSGEVGLTVIRNFLNLV